MTFDGLVPRVLIKIGILGAGQQPSAEDRLLVLDKLRSVHASLKAERQLRWTQADIPDFAEEPYIVMAAAISAADFGRPADPSWWSWGRGQIAAGNQIGGYGPVAADYY